MFSGIVERPGEIIELDLKEKWGRITVRASGWDPVIELGESIAVQGICLTAAEIDGDTLSFDVLRETFEKTTLGEKAVGQKLNLERSLRWGQPMGGHIVVGHVDGVGHVADIREVGRDWSFEFTCSEEMLDGIVYKGSVSIDGVSLTVAELKENGFVVHIIPYTYEVTTFGDLKPGDGVNLEIDLLSKYVRRLLERGQVLQGVTWDQLRETGLIHEEISEEE
jgi:riboflavin synthase